MGLTPTTINATYMTYTRNMSENAMPLPYEVQEMTTTEARKHLPELVNMAAYGHVTTVLTRTAVGWPASSPRKTPGSTARPGRKSSAKPTRTLPRAASGGSRTTTISSRTWKPWTMRQEGEIPDHRGV